MQLIGLAVILAISLALAPLAAEAQQAEKVYRIGYLTTFPMAQSGHPSFMQGLLEHGYVEGQNLVIERRSADGNPAKLHDLAAELVRLRVAVIVAGDSSAIAPAKASTATIPIVMSVSGDPVRDGFVVTLARPGGNVTGLCNVSPELAGKRLELLKEVVPKLARVAVLGVPHRLDWPEMAAAASALGLHLQTLKVESHDQFEEAFKLAARERVGGLIVLPSPHSRIPTGSRSSPGRRAPSCRRCMHCGSTRRSAGSWPMARTLPRCTAVQPPTWTRSSRARSPPIFLSSSPPSSSYSSTSRPRRRWDSRSRRRSFCGRTR
jgi:ABC transporter substrate binding protein